MVQLTTSLIALYVIALVHGQPQYEVQVELPIAPSYRLGFFNQLADGTCCSSSDTSPSCLIGCTEIHIDLCFKETSNDTLCTLGDTKISLPSVIDEIIVFNATEEATTTTYPGSFAVHFVISALNPVRIIDSGMDVLDISVDNGQTIATVSGSRAFIRVKDFEVACKEGYFGPDCGTPCSPRDDSTGHFTCDENGAIVCLPGYQNTATNCVEEVTTGPTTNPQTNADTTDTQPNTTPESTTTQGGQEAEAAVVPMAVGGAVGGGIVLLFIIVGLVAVIVLAWRSKKQRNVQQPEGDAVVFKALKSHDNDSREGDSAKIESGVTTSADYTTVNRDKYTQQEEAPPIIPYRGDPYTEVARTGLFGTDTATPEQRGLPEVVMANSPAYAEVRQPQIVYTDLAISKVRAKSDSQRQLVSDMDNATVQYSSIY